MALGGSHLWKTKDGQYHFWVQVFYDKTLTTKEHQLNQLAGKILNVTERVLSVASFIPGPVGAIAGALNAGIEIMRMGANGELTSGLGIGMAAAIVASSVLHVNGPAKGAALGAAEKKLGKRLAKRIAKKIAKKAAKRGAKQMKKLSKGEIKAPKDRGIDPHDLKPNSKFDLFKDKDGNIFVKPKNGAGPGDPTGINTGGGS